MITAREIYRYIDSFAPFDSAMGFDNVGILVGSPEAKSKRVLLALDASAEVLEEAHSIGADIVFTHHPIIFNPLKRLDTKSVQYTAVKYGITVISAHTNLDIAPGGVNDSLAGAVGVKILQRFDDECAALGELDDKKSCGEYADFIRHSLELSGLRYTDTGRRIKSVLVSCGAGGGNVFLAEKCGVDAIVTGEIKHHEIVYANDRGTAVFDLGHYGSEKCIIPIMKKKLSESFPDTVFIIAESDSDRVIYI